MSETGFQKACPHCGGLGMVDPTTHFWIVASMGDSLDYWGPYVSEEVARQSRMYRPGFGYTIIEVPFEVPAECLTGLRLSDAKDAVRTDSSGGGTP